MQEMAVKIKEKPIKGFERYTIDVNGNVYDTKRNEYRSQWIDGQGYPTVNLCGEDKVYHRGVHILVADAFIANPNNLPQVNHIDAVKSNPNVENLEWVTPAENVKHAIENGLIRGKQSVDLYNGDEYICTYPSIVSTAKSLGINKSRLGTILRGERPNHYFYNFKYSEEGQSTIKKVETFDVMANKVSRTE